MSDRFATGTCLCGAVALHIPSLNHQVDVCHCGMCRKWGSGPFLAIECGRDVRIDGQDHMAIYNSSDWAERAFCKRCGSSLFYRLKEDGTMAVSAGLFDPSHLRLGKQIFIDEKPAYYAFANETEKLTGDEVFAAHNATK